MAKMGAITKTEQPIHEIRSSRYDWTELCVRVDALEIGENIRVPLELEPAEMKEEALEYLKGTLRNQLHRHAMLSGETKERPLYAVSVGFGKMKEGDDVLEVGIAKIEARAKRPRKEKKNGNGAAPAAEPEQPDLPEDGETTLEQARAAEKTAGKGGGKGGKR